MHSEEYFLKRQAELEIETLLLEKEKLEVQSKQIDLRITLLKQNKKALENAEDNKVE